MRSVIASLIVVFSSTCFAIDPGTKYDERWVAENLPKVREMLQLNIQACNEENIDLLMQTLHPALPGLDEFRAEAEKLFKDTDLYARILAVQYDVSGTTTNHREAVFAITILQHTVVTTGSEEDKTFFREHAAMIPPEYSKYVMEFLPDGKGGWKCGMIRGRPERVYDEYVSAVMENMKAKPAACANGNCRKPMNSANSVFQ